MDTIFINFINLTTELELPTLLAHLNLVLRTWCKLLLETDMTK